MENNKICRVKDCTWATVLCPELCAPHWWALPKNHRDVITRAQINGLKAGTHPNGRYILETSRAISELESRQSNRVKYVRLPGDVDSRHARLTNCLDCQRQTVHHSFIRDGEPGLSCSECQTMVPAIPAGAHVLPGMENPS